MWVDKTGFLNKVNIDIKGDNYIVTNVIRVREFFGIEEDFDKITGCALVFDKPMSKRNRIDIITQLEILMILSNNNLLFSSDIVKEFHIYLTYSNLMIVNLEFKKIRIDEPGNIIYEH